MADPKDSALDKAENVARRILEQLGSKIDLKLAPGRELTLSSQVIGDLASRLENSVESSLREDEQGVRRVAPNRFKVLFTYEETSDLTPQYIEAVGKELTATVFEYINNRRYSTLGTVAVETSRDLFAKSTQVKASFVNDRNPAASQSASGTTAVEVRSIFLESNDRRSYRVELRVGSAPAYVGRAAGNAVRIDDPSVSRLHCSLSLRGDGIVVVADLGSVNGTSINEEILGRDEARALRKGDVVGIGDFKLTVSEIT